MKRTITFVVLSILIMAAVVFAADYGILRYRIARGKQPFGTATVYRYYAVEEKNRKTEYVFDSAGPQTCVRSLFAHLGYTPCWYLNRHTEQRIAM